MPRTKTRRHEEGRRVAAQDGVHPIRHNGVRARSLPQPALLRIASFPPPDGGEGRAITGKGCLLGLRGVG